MEHDSVVSIVARNSLSISERASGSGHMQLDRLDVAPQAYQSSFAANVLGNDTGWVPKVPRPFFVSNLVGIHSGTIRCAMPVKLACVKSNSQVIIADSCPQGSTQSNKPEGRSAALKARAGGETRSNAHARSKLSQTVDGKLARHNHRCRP